MVRHMIATSPGQSRVPRAAFAIVEAMERRLYWGTSLPPAPDDPLNAPGTYNLAATVGPTLQKLRTGKTASIVALGDSLTFRENSAYLPFFSADLRGEYGNGGYGYQGFSYQTFAGFNAADTAWVNRGLVNQDTDPHHSLDGLWAQSSSPPFHWPDQPVFDSAYLDAQSPHVQI